MLRAVIERSEIDDISISNRLCFRGSVLNDLLTMRCFTQRASFICVLADGSHASETKQYKQKYPFSFCYSPLDNLTKFPSWLLLYHPKQPPNATRVPTLYSSTWKLLPEQMIIQDLMLGKMSPTQTCMPRW